MDTKIKDLTKQNYSSNFFYSFLFLPKEKREAINIIYAFCKASDDIADTMVNPEMKIKNLNEWRFEFTKGITNNSIHSLLNEVGRIIHKFDIPILPFTQLLNGMEMDIHNKYYHTFDELYQYCYNVAGTVGIITSKIFGYKNPGMNDYAVNLGIALQLTNIIRDIKQDSILGRIYIPIEDLNRFSYTVEDIVKNNYNDNFIKLIEYQFKRALYYFNKANEYCCKEDKNKFLAAEIMRNIYFSILMKIKKNNFDVYKNRIGLSKLNKILIAIKTALSY